MLKRVFLGGFNTKQRIKLCDDIKKCSYLVLSCFFSHRLSVFSLPSAVFLLVYGLYNVLNIFCKIEKQANVNTYPDQPG